MKVDEMPVFMEALSQLTGRQFNEFQTDLWYQALSRYTLNDCRTAVYDHLAHSSGFLTPADVAGRVKQLRNDRVAAAGTPPHPPEYEPGTDWAAYQADYLRWRKEWNEAIANGMPLEAANRTALERIGRQQAITPTIPFKVQLALKGTTPDEQQH